MLRQQKYILNIEFCRKIIKRFIQKENLFRFFKQRIKSVAIDASRFFYWLEEKKWNLLNRCKVYVEAHNIISPLGLTSDVNFTNLEKGKSSIIEHDNILYDDEKFWASILQETTQLKIEEKDQQFCHFFQNLNNYSFVLFKQH